MKQKTGILKALSDETRIRIIMLLLHGELQVLEITRTLSETQTKISRHLSILRKEKIVTDRRRANTIYYSLNPENSLFYNNLFPSLKNMYCEEHLIKNDYENLKKKLKNSTLLEEENSKVAKFPVLFVCVHNSGRSQIAEAYMKKFGGDFFLAESAGLSPSSLKQSVITAMLEEGIDISSMRSKNINRFLYDRRSFSYIITVCRESEALGLPVFPGQVKKIHWDIDDPYTLKGNESSRLKKTKQIRDQIKLKVKELIKENTQLRVDKLKEA